MLPENVKTTLREELENLRPDFVAMAKEMWDNPEHALREFKAANLICDTLAKAGFKVEKPVGGLETAFIASHGDEDSPRVALLAEYDATPGFGHACGHNLIASTAAAAARALAKMGHPGQLLVVGCPGEEGGGGKIFLTESGCFDGIDAAIYLHPFYLTRIGGRTAATINVELKFTGRPAHAGRAPHTGINALAALTGTFTLLGLLNQQLPPDIRYNWVVSEGGRGTGIVPDIAAAKVGLRGSSHRQVESLFKHLENCAKGASIATGAELEIKKGLSYMPRLTNPVIAKVMEDYLKEAGFECDPMPEQEFGSTDVGHVSMRVPTVEGYVQICDRDIPNHTKGFEEAANSERGFEAMLKGAWALACTALTLLTDASLVEGAWEKQREGVKARESE
jgi:amidohydrolase